MDAPKRANLDQPYGASSSISGGWRKKQGMKKLARVTALAGATTALWAGVSWARGR